jgi:site-specific DNA recombinase
MAAAVASGGLAEWAERSALGRVGNLTAAGPVPGRLRFVFYGRVSTEDWQDPVTSRARQREQAEALVRGHGVIVAEFFDVGESRTVAWARRPQSAILVAQLADPGRGWDAVVIGEYERARTGWTPTRGRRMSCGGSSPSGWPGTPSRGSRVP